MKYIVYLTTNLVNKKIYIGVHKTINPDKFDGYLGNGVKTTDRSTYKHSKTPFEMAVNKYGINNFIRKTLKVFDTLEEALALEVKLVDSEFIKRRDTYNITLGGGLPPIKVKTIYQYSLDGEFIKEWYSITEAAMSLNKSNSSIGKAIFDRTPSSGFLWTDFKHDKLDLNTFKIDLNKTSCHVYNSKGTFIKSFNSLAECANELNLNKGDLTTSVKGRFKILGYYVSLERFETFPIHQTIIRDKIYQYDVSGKFIKEWNTVKEINEHFGVTVAISNAIRLGRITKGFQWSYEKLPNMKNLEVIKIARKVGKYTIDGKLVKVFNTVSKAKADTSGAPGVLTGKRKTAGGHIFKYLD